MSKFGLGSLTYAKISYFRENIHELHTTPDGLANLGES